MGPGNEARLTPYGTDVATSPRLVDTRMRVNLLQ